MLATSIQCLCISRFHHLSTKALHIRQRQTVEDSGTLECSFDYIQSTFQHLSLLHIIFITNHPNM
jgi:hypothetical protein